MRQSGLFRYFRECFRAGLVLGKLLIFIAASGKGSVLIGLLLISRLKVRFLPRSPTFRINNSDDGTPLRMNPLNLLSPP